MHCIRPKAPFLRAAIVSAACTAAACGGRAPQREERRPPNVLFIAADDLRVELGCYGDTVVQSPNIDRLAREGMRFSRAYCQQPLCNPSRASILTGMRPTTLGICDLHTNVRVARPDVVTLPQLFTNAGWHSRDIGKIFHNSHQPDHPGDPASWSAPEYMHYGGHGDDVATIDGEVPPNMSAVPRTEMRDVPDNAYFDGRIADEAVRTLRELKDEPFFLAVGFWKPHLPFNAPKKYWDLYDPADVALPANPDAPLGCPPIALHDGIELMRTFPGGLADDETRTLRHGYYAAVSYMDAQVGRLLDELDALDLDDSTIVVLWSDHGFHLGEHDLWCKNSDFELDARVPLLIRVPGQDTAGEASNALVELVDVYPTLAELCGLRPPDVLEGTSLVPVLENAHATVKDAAFTQTPRPATRKKGVPPTAMGCSMRTDRFRYTEWRDEATGGTLARELYDHDRDPRETVNVVDAPEFAADVRELAAALEVQFPRTATAPRP